MSASKNLRSSAQLQKLAGSLFADKGRREDLIESIAARSAKKPALLWVSERPVPHPFDTAERSSWQPEFVDFVQGDVRPGAHELHTAGAYYCLDGSSVFEAVSMLEHRGTAPAVLDLCASPGGKSVFAARGLRPSLLVSNEVIGKRTGALISNLERCRIASIVIREDVKHLAETWPSAFDLLVLDAPCSGQSLVARGQDAPGCFHPAAINKNSNRQKRLLATASKMAAEGSHIAYMTCTYSREENEAIIEWFLKRFDHFESVPVPALAAHRSELTECFAYRLFPFEGFGAGGFTSLLRCRSGDSRRGPDLTAVRKIRVIGNQEAD